MQHLWLCGAEAWKDCGTQEKKEPLYSEQTDWDSDNDEPNRHFKLVENTRKPDNVAASAKWFPRNNTVNKQPVTTAAFLPFVSGGFCSAVFGWPDTIIFQQILLDFRRMWSLEILFGQLLTSIIYVHCRVSGKPLSHCGLLKTLKGWRRKIESEQVAMACCC